MSGQILETERSALEELERIEQAIASRIMYNPKVLPDTHTLASSSSLNGKRKRPIRTTLLHKLEIAKMLDRYQQQCEYLNSIMGDTNPTDKGGETLALQHKRESDDLGKHGNTSREQFNQFYSQLSAIKDFHRRYPNEAVDDIELTYKMRRKIAKTDEAAEGEREETANRDSRSILSAFGADINLDSLFSGEEHYGRYLDLVSFHERFVNLKFVRRKIAYVQYLDLCREFTEKEIYPTARLYDDSYFKYAVDLHAYLEAFVRKSRILDNPEATLLSIERDFNSNWDNDKPPKWFESESSATVAGDSSEDPLYCKACEKQFSNQAVYDNHLPGRKHKKNSERLEDSASTVTNTGTKDNLRLRAIASHEFQIQAIAEFIEQQFKDTKSNVERRQALTDRERQQEALALEREAAEDDVDSDDERNNIGDGDDEDENGVVYNPLKLPIGWDGKPIPYWLWKLQGLGIEYSCEICGNYYYMGRKMFDRHFMEPRHAHGLRCLGIEPGPLLRGITKISEARELWEQIRKGSAQTERRNETAVEMEDDEGNVMSEKVYNDLKKQGLL